MSFSANLRILDKTTGDIYNKDMIKDISSIYELVREEVKPIVKPLVSDAKHWAKLIKQYRKLMDDITPDVNTIKLYKSYYNMMKEAQTQYVAITKVLLSAVRRDAAAEDDDFENFLKMQDFD